MAVDEVIDRLYELPLEAFTEARNEAARELRKAGDREAAERVKALRKPSLVAGAVNRLVREHRAEVEEFLDAAAGLRDAQFAGKGDLASASKREREALDRLIGLGGEGVRQTLLAAAVDDEAAQQLREARLDRELEPRGFGTLLAHATGHSKVRTVARPGPARPAAPAPQELAAPALHELAAPAPKPRQAQEPDDAAARVRLRDAKAGLSAAEEEERRARHRWDAARSELEKARAAVDKAQRDLDGPREN